MRCNNKHVLEGSGEGEKLAKRLLSYMDDKIKDNYHENIASIK